MEEDPEIVALVQDPEAASLHLLSQAQSNDQVLQEVKIALQQHTTLSWQFQGKRDKLVQKEGVLYYQHTDSSPLQTIIPCSLQRAVLEQIHDKGGHLGVHKTLAKLREWFCWPGHGAQVEKWVKE